MILARVIGTVVSTRKDEGLVGYKLLVVQVEAMDLDDAETIAQAFVANLRAAFSEILIYAQREGAPSTIRRVRWTATDGFETLDFEVPDK